MSAKSHTCFDLIFYMASRRCFLIIKTDISQESYLCSNKKQSVSLVLTSNVTRSFTMPDIFLHNVIFHFKTDLIWFCGCSLKHRSVIVLYNMFCFKTLFNVPIVDRGGEGVPRERQKS